MVAASKSASARTTRRCRQRAFGVVDGAQVLEQRRGLPRAVGLPRPVGRVEGVDRQGALGLHQLTAHLLAPAPGWPRVRR